MKHLITIFALSTTLFSCKKEVFQDEKLVPYAESVKKELYDRGIEFSLNFNLVIEEGLADNRGAWGLSKGNSIYIDKGIYESKIKGGQEYKLEYLMLHEIGHNVFGLDHTDSQFDELSRPIIMYYPNWQFISKQDRELMYDSFVSQIR